ncbi:MAG TPA: type II secretion system protein GspL [Allosphingosinicella sp.]|nr:type II secretion system protein GspL [Allosphingosinicella sp.]
MKTSPTDPAGSAILVLFADEAGALGCWLLAGDGGAAGAGEVSAGLPIGWAKAVLVVPGEQVTVHWLDLADGLAPAQAAAAARLMLADASAEPIADLHVAVGRPEGGLTPAALVSSARMSAWLAAAAAAGVDPDAVVPSPLLLDAPADGFIRREVGALSDYRGPAAAFTLEPDLAEALTGGAAVETIDEARFEAELGPVLAAPPLDLRQGPFGRRRQWKVEAGRLRRVAAFAIALAVLTLAVQVATILSYTFAADRIQAEADALAGGATGSGDGLRPAFGAAASVLFEAVRSTPNVELSRIDYRPDGSLAATVMIDNPATFTAFQARIEAVGLRVEPGEQRTAGGRATADLIVRPA